MAYTAGLEVSFALEDVDIASKGLDSFTIKSLGNRDYCVPSSKAFKDTINWVIDTAYPHSRAAQISNKSRAR